MALDIVKEPEPIDFDAHMAAHATADAEPVKEEVPPVVEKVEEKPPVAAAVVDDKKPVDDKPIDDAQLVTDPDTGEKVDKRTREGKRIFSLLERAHKAEAMIASLLANQKQPAAKEEKAEAPVAPKIEDFPSTQEYLDAAIKFGIDQSLPSAVRAATQGIVHTRETETRNAAIDAREATFLETHPDYRDVLKTGLLPELSAGVQAKHPTAIAIQRVLQTSEDGPRLAYMLGKDAALHARLAALPPESALLELGKLASVPAKSADEVVEKPKPRSQAPPPPEVPEARTTVVESDAMNLSFDEHVAAGNASDRRAAKARRGAAA